MKLDSPEMDRTTCFNHCCRNHPFKVRCPASWQSEAVKSGKTGSCSFGGMIPVFWGSFQTSFFTIFGVFSPFFTIFSRFKLKNVFFGKKLWGESRVIFHFFWRFHHYLLENFSGTRPERGDFSSNISFSAKLKPFFTIFSRFFPQITKYHKISVSVKSTLFSLKSG